MIIIWIAAGIVGIVIAAFIGVAISYRRMLRNRYYALNSRISYVEHNIQRLFARIEAFESNMEEIVGKIETLFDENTAICMDKSDMNKKIAGLIEDMSDLAEELHVKDMAIDNLEKGVAGIKRGCNDRISYMMLNDIQTEMKYVQKDLRKLKKKVKAWEA